MTAKCPTVPIPYKGTTGHWPQYRVTARDSCAGQQGESLVFTPSGVALGGTVSGTKTGTQVSQDGGKGIATSGTVGWRQASADDRAASSAEGSEREQLRMFAREVSPPSETKAQDQ
jgi:hypothetical protein